MHHELDIQVARKGLRVSPDRFIDQIATKYRFLTESHEFDELLTQSMPPYARFRLEGQ